MVTMNDIAAWKKLLDAIPREGWMHARKDDDGNWQVVERGEAPPAWRELSSVNRFFGIDMHEPIKVGDRIAVGEEAWEAVRIVGDTWEFTKVVHL